MQFIQGTIKKIIRGEGGSCRLLLTRKDGSEFVVETLNDNGVDGIGTLYRAGGFEEAGEFKGRKVYKQAADAPNVSAVDLSKKGEPDSQGFVKLPDDAGVPLEVKSSSIELIAIINLTSQLMQKPPSEIIDEINELYRKVNHVCS